MIVRMKTLFHLFLFAMATGHVSAAELRLLPGAIRLDGPEAIQHVLALRAEGGDFLGEDASVTYSIAPAGIADIIDGVVYARGNGTAVLTAKAGDSVATNEITVENFDQPFAWSFKGHVMPVITRQGCNMGACHGALAGKGGFRLSLRGYDPAADFYTMTREARGRRVDPLEPAKSLILTKPTMATPHKGGRKLDPRSREYRILSEWVANGSPAPSSEEAAVVTITVDPPLSILKNGAKQRFLVTAHYDDGSSLDVTDWAKFASADETVALVDESGSAEVIGYGEGAVTALFASKVAIARVRSPFPNTIPDELFTAAPKANFIDDLVLAQLRQLNLPPSGRSSDGDFVRRAYLDTIGKLPTIDETRAFVADPSADKRTKLIDALLQREEFVDYWSYRFSDIFLVNGGLLRPAAVKAYYDWIRGGVAGNRPWDAMVSELITAKGISTENGATNFYAVHQDPETLAENTAQAFMSLSIGCAKCHDHPLEKWTNDQYYAFANLFSRVRAKGWGGETRNGDGVRMLYVESRGDLIQPRTGKPQIPAPLDGEPLDPDATGDRREALAAWLTAPENPHFARSITNRIWAAYFGRGLVEPVDDLRASNPASNEPLLDALTAHLVEKRFDLKALMRSILESETYQRSGEVLSENRDDPKYLSRHNPRRLMAEVLYDAIADVTDVAGVFDKVALNDGSSEKTEFYKEGTRALELYDSAVQSYFLKAFGRNDREITCECERSNQPSMIQVLHLANGDTLNGKLASNKSVVEKLITAKADDNRIVEEASLATLSRLPTPEEKAGFLEMLGTAAPGEKRAAIEDLFWALMTSREFLFQH
jgi:hypothetical protein